MYYDQFSELKKCTKVPFKNKLNSYFCKLIILENQSKHLRVKLLNKVYLILLKMFYYILFLFRLYQMSFQMSFYYLFHISSYSASLKPTVIRLSSTIIGRLISMPSFDKTAHASVHDISLTLSFNPCCR